MPYLSKIRINPMRKAGTRMLRDPQLVHGMVMQGLPEPAGDRPLWRLEASGDRRPELVVLTGAKPDWAHVVEQAGWPHADGEHCVIRDYVTLFPHLSVGREFAFRVTANPVENTRNPVKPTAAQESKRAHGGTRGFRVGHRTAAHQLDWFLRRTGRWGFAIPAARLDRPAPGFEAESQPAPDIRIAARENLRFGKHAPEASSRRRAVTLTTATFEGRLVVEDPVALKQALLSGLGPAKAYGCGLLTLAPLPGARSG